MADRTWNGVDGRLYSEWRLSKPARAILAHVIAICPNQYGIYDPSPFGLILDWWTGIFSREQIEAAWQELEVNRILSGFRNNECGWLRKKFKRQLPALRTEKHRLGVVAFLKNYPEIENDFLELYGIQITETGIQITGLPIQIESELNLARVECPKKGSYYPDPEPDPEPEHKKNSPPAASASPALPGVEPPPAAPKTPKPKPVKEPKPLPEPTAEALAIAQQMEADIRKLQEDGYEVAGNWRRQPVQVARSLDASGVDKELLTQAWDWALQDSFWQPEIVKQVTFVQSPNRWKELLNRYIARGQNRNGRPKSGPMDYTPETRARAAK